MSTTDFSRMCAKLIPALRHVEHKEKLKTLNLITLENNVEIYFKFT
jgi:hypothetical protein